MAALGESIPPAPTGPNLGRREAAISRPYRPVGPYAPPRYRTDIATAVYNMPRLPTNENGARELKFFMRQRGRRTDTVRPTVTGPFVAAIPAVESKLTKVSPRIIE
jgi:hypothetical protein